MKNESENTEVKILIVDDRIENLIALEKTLLHLNLQIFKATSGNEALRLMLSHDFAVALIDVMMPVMNGFEVAELMHSNEMTKHIPIIFITAINKDETYVVKGMESGAVDYLYKPVNDVILKCKVKIFVDLYNIKQKLEKANLELLSYQEVLKKRNEELQKLSEEDSLTKISNRRAFVKKLSYLLDLAKKENGNVVLFFLDIDNFKTINDQYGHEVGDILLKTVSTRLANILRSSDVIYNINQQPRESSIGRLGGDEFVIAAGNISEKKTIHDLAQRIMKSVSEPIIYKELKLSITSSIGIACFPDSGDSKKELLRAADQALYRAKKSGKNTYCIANEKDVD